MHLFKKNAFPSQTTNATCYKSTYFKDKYHMWGPVGPQRASGIKVALDKKFLEFYLSMGSFNLSLSKYMASGEPHIKKSHKIKKNCRI